MTSGVSQRTWLTMKKKMNKTNKEKNQQHERDQLMRVRPKQPAYDFAPLEAAFRSWFK